MEETACDTLEELLGPIVDPLQTGVLMNTVRPLLTEFVHTLPVQERAFLCCIKWRLTLNDIVECTGIAPDDRVRMSNHIIVFERCPTPLRHANYSLQEKSLRHVQPQLEIQGFLLDVDQILESHSSFS